jgi:hypothetical protein
MAIDYIIDYGCDPKRALGTGGILERLKERDRARTIISLFRSNGDQRPPSEMGFEFTRNTTEGEEETRIIVVQDLLDSAAELDPYAPACVGCAANASGEAFGCMGQIQYPFSAAAERWLIDRLPAIDEPLLWLLLRQGVQEMGYDGATVAPLRPNATYFETSQVLMRDLADFSISSDQVFEMLFLLGDVQPPHAGMLLQFFDAVPRAKEASQIAPIMNRALSADMIAQQYPLQLKPNPLDDHTIADVKRFFAALHRAWSLNVPLLLDV